MPCTRLWDHAWISVASLKRAGAISAVSEHDGLAEFCLGSRRQGESEDMSKAQTTNEQALLMAAHTALSAPSIFNTQPWRWEIRRDRARLFADRRRQLLVVDPEGRLFAVSCGVALHHARTALAAAGHAAEVSRLPDPADADLLAEFAITGTRDASLADLHAGAAIARRRTDRRPFTAQRVPDAVCNALLAAAAAQGAHAHLVDDTGIAVLGLAAQEASAVQLADPAYRAELADWTNRPSWSGEGVDPENAVRDVPRRVPVRDFAPFGGDTLHPGPGNDVGARYLLICTDTDTPDAWLRAGEALSAVLLDAVTAGLSSAAISDVTELPATRDRLRTILPGMGNPQVAVRIGYPPPGEPPPQAPRRPAEDTIDHRF